MRMKHALAAVAAAGLIVLAVVALAAGSPERRHMTVSAEGEVEAVPDVARLSLQVENTADTAEAAKEAVDRISTRILATAREYGLAEEDVRASQIRVAPDYEWHDGRRELRGQRVERGIDLRLKDMERYSALVAALVKAGVTRIGRVSFELSDEEALERDALEKAIVRARRKAEAMARAAGVSLAGVYSVSESSAGGGPGPVRTMAMAAESKEVPMPVDVQTIRAQVTVVFLLE